MPSITRFCGHGFALLEIAIALMLVSVAMAALAPVLVACGIMVSGARDDTQATALAVSRLEQLSALPFEQRADTLVITTDEWTNLAGAFPSSSGTGLQPQDGRSAWSETSGFVDRTSADGRPPEALAGEPAFVRRWAIAWGPGVGGVETRLFHVFARASVLEDRESPRGSPDRRPGDTWLFTVRARILR